ncbi:MAG: hypothetical protein JNK04_06445 [Myxococcales bacterium]|nr:hypothetical protein [Myxococcales bacterium]
MASTSTSVVFALVLSQALGCGASTAEPGGPEAVATASDAPLVSTTGPEAATSTAPPVASASSAPTAEPAPFTDTLAGLGPGVSQDDLEKRFGKPKSKSPLQEEQATGEHVSSWKWADGFSAMMAGSAKGKLHARLLIVEAPSKLATSRGIGIGSTRKEVLAAYAKEVDSQASNDEMVVVGEMLGGLRVHFDKQEKVRSLALGTDGE